MHSPYSYLRILEIQHGEVSSELVRKVDKYLFEKGEYFFSECKGHTVGWPPIPALGGSEEYSQSDVVYFFPEMAAVGRLRCYVQNNNPPKHNKITLEMIGNKQKSIDNFLETVKSEVVGPFFREQDRKQKKE